MNLIGDVEGKVCVMLDDMIDTGGTLLAGAELCRTLGAREVYACATRRGVLATSGGTVRQRRAYRSHRDQFYSAYAGERFRAVDRVIRRELTR